jgi:hypothetical protein
MLALDPLPLHALRMLALDPLLPLHALRTLTFDHTLLALRPLETDALLALRPLETNSLLPLRPGELDPLLALRALELDSFLALRSLELDPLLALRTLRADALDALLALGPSLLGLGLGRLGLLAVLSAVATARLGLGGSSDCKRCDGRDQKGLGHEKSRLFGLAPFWRKAADYNMNGGARASRATRFTSSPTRLNAPLREVHFGRSDITPTRSCRAALTYNRKPRG